MYSPKGALIRLRPILIVTLLCALLAGCAPAPVEETKGTTAPAAIDTVPQDETQSPETILAETEPSETEPLAFNPQGTAVDDSTLDELTELFADPKGWYARTLTSDFAQPGEIDLKELFYSGIPEADNALCEEEKAYLLTQAWYEDAFMLDVYRIPAEEMGKVLQTYLGISLQDTLGIGAENMTYWTDTDCYYLSHGDSNAFRVNIHSAYVQADGTIALYYSRDYSFDAEEAAPEQVAVLKRTEGGYQVVSNLPVKP